MVPLNANLDKNNFINHTVSDRVEIKFALQGDNNGVLLQNKLTNEMWSFPASLVND